MGLFNKGALKRIERQLARALEGDEDILEWDIGKTPRGDRVDCVATTRAVYRVGRGGQTLRVPYTDFRSTGGGPSWIGFATASGSEYVVDFGRAPRGLSDVIVEQYRAVAKGRRQFHASWGSNGATFLVVSDGGGWNIDSFAFDKDPGVDIGMLHSMASEAAHAQLEVALGQQPSFPLDWSLGEIAWEPPLSESPGT